LPFKLDSIRTNYTNGSTNYISAINVVRKISEEIKIAFAECNHFISSSDLNGK